jgi:hypothetical protein
MARVPPENESGCVHQILDMSQKLPDDTGRLESWPREGVRWGKARLPIVPNYRCRTPAGWLGSRLRDPVCVRLNSWIIRLIWCFIAGFAERLIPDVLTRDE